MKLSLIPIVQIYANYGDWVAPFGDEEYGKVMQKQMEPADILLGRKTFDIFEAYWPKHADGWPGINEVSKYVLSTTRQNSDWENTEFLSTIEDIKKLKNFRRRRYKSLRKRYTCSAFASA
ncbi:dihydrofolate reductase family protein [Flavobacterium flavigenum]|uniref:dihydrofolate reductase family protein n=1 Tax=Flavobacterium flavigenum TaxID=3003258 RepID=UPI0024821D4A|nr:hypothetical protein [Flavobacterium flavigenum]